MNRGLAAFGALFGLGLLAALVAVLATSGPQTAGSTGVPPDAFVVRLAPGQSACQGSAPLQREADYAQVVVGTARGSRARVGFVAERGGSVVMRGVLAGEPGAVRLPLRGTRDRAQVDRVCIRNLGAGPLSVAGRSGGAVKLRGRQAIEPVTMSVIYVRADPPSWLSQAENVARRFAHLRLAPAGASTLWIVLAVALLGSIGAVLSTVIAQRD